MPLYACERCGFTSAAFRPDAVSAHHLEYPDCDGVMRIVFRSDDRYRGQAAAARMTPPSAAAAKVERHELPVAGGQPFDMREWLDVDGMLRLSLMGDLDLAVADKLSGRLADLKATGRAVRLDLSQLAFIDSSGLQALLVALTDARWTEWQLEVARDVSPSVARAAEIVGIAQVLWPEGRADVGSDTAHAATTGEGGGPS